MITVRSTINLAHQSVPNIIPVVQGDTGRSILFTLADFTIPEGATARYFVMKPSGLAVYNDATIDGNTVLVNLTAQSIIETGDNYGQVRISVGEDIVTSFDFILHVEPFRGIDAVESDAEVNIFDRALEQAQETVDTMVENAEQAIEDAAEAAAEDVLESIPADYTALSNEVDDLKTTTGTDTIAKKTQSGSTSASYGAYNQTINTAVANGSNWLVNLDLSGVDLVDASVYGIISAGNYTSEPLAVFTEVNKNVVFASSGQYIGFYLYVNTAEKSVSYTSDVTFIEISSLSPFNDISVLQNDISVLQNDLSNTATIEEVVSVVDSKVYSKTGSAYTWNNQTTGLVVATPISKAKVIVSVSIIANKASEAYFGLLTIDNGTGTVEYVKLLKLNTGENTINLLAPVDSEKTYYPFVRLKEGVIKFSGDSSGTQYYTISASDDIAVGSTYAVTTVSGNGISVLSCKVVYTGQLGNTITVAKSGGDFSTISSAVAYAKTIASVNNPVTILIYPGTYDEVVKIRNQKYISLVGVNRDTCILRDTSGKYANSPLLVSGEFSISNLTIIANHDNAGQWSPTWVVGDNTTYASYCVHCDGEGGDSNNPALGRFFNCKLYSECCNAAGLGLNPYQTLEFDNCVIERYVTDNAYWDDEHYAGAIACHSSVSTAVADEHDEHLVLKNCVIISNGSKALQFYHYHVGSPMDLTAIGCSLQDASGIANVVRWYKGEEANYVTQLSHGNSTDELNYSAT